MLALSIAVGFRGPSVLRPVLTSMGIFRVPALVCMLTPLLAIVLAEVPLLAVVLAVLLLLAFVLATVLLLAFLLAAVRLLALAAVPAPPGAIAREGRAGQGEGQKNAQYAQTCAVHRILLDCP
jgi:hypothetical protein